MQPGSSTLQPLTGTISTVSPRYPARENLGPCSESYQFLDVAVFVNRSRTYEYITDSSWHLALQDNHGKV